MVSRHNIRRQLPRLLALFLILGMLLVACERPLQNNNAPAAEEVTEEDLEQGGGAPAETEEGEAVGEEEQVEEATEAEPTVEPTAETEMAEEVTEAEATEETEAEETEAEEAGTEEEASPRPEEEAEEETAEAEETEAEETEAEAEEAETEGAEETVTEGAAEEEATEPRTHVVQPGENLYRIGLQYGISWVVLAEANNITNPNRIVVGQELTIPSESNGDDDPTPTPGEETTYVVQPGDNLYRIGRMFNLSWVEIAEANGIVNPNRILVGQQLTIPGEAPPSEVTHTVQPGETLFRISLEYGVPWTTIATANDINPPYVIYPGQVLTIPGG